MDLDQIKLGNDPLFKIIDETRELKTRYEKIIFYNRVLGCFAVLSLVASLVSTVFYTNKQHLGFMGLISLLHLANLTLGELNSKWKHRYVLLVIIISDCLWLGATSLFLITYIIILDPDKHGSKADFNKEIHFHVVILFYFIAAMMFIYRSNDFCEYLIKNPPDILSRVNSMQTAASLPVMLAQKIPINPPLQLIKPVAKMMPKLQLPTESKVKQALVTISRTVSSKVAPTVTSISSTAPSTTQPRILTQTAPKIDQRFPVKLEAKTLNTEIKKKSPK